MSRNDIVDLFGRNLSRTRLERALALLVRAGLARRSQDHDTGGRPREVWHAI
jgi:predicted transcriptional regulator